MPKSPVFLLVLVTLTSTFPCVSPPHPSNHTPAYPSRKLIPPPVDLTTWNSIHISFGRIANRASSTLFTAQLDDTVLPAVTSYYSKALSINPLLDGKITPVEDTCDDVLIPQRNIADGVDADL